MNTGLRPSGTSNLRGPTEGASAIAGGAAVAIAWELNAYRPALGAVVAATVFGIRGLALHRHWHGRRAWKR